MAAASARKTASRAARVTFSFNIFCFPPFLHFLNILYQVVVLKEDDRHFRITVPVAVSNQFFGWVVGLGKAVRIEAPEAVRNEFKEFLKGIQERYE